MEQKGYAHIDTDDSAISLHDCYAKRIQFEKNILSFYFQNGFWVTPSHNANNSDKTLRTDFSQVDYRIDDDVSIYVFRKNILGRTIRIEWTLEELVGLINNGTFSLEFLYQYKGYNEELLKCGFILIRNPITMNAKLKSPHPKSYIVGITYATTKLGKLVKRANI